MKTFYLFFVLVFPFHNSNAASLETGLIYESWNPKLPKYLEVKTEDRTLSYFNFSFLENEKVRPYITTQSDKDYRIVTLIGGILISVSDFELINDFFIEQRNSSFKASTTDNQDGVIDIKSDFTTYNIGLKNYERGTSISYEYSVFNRPYMVGDQFDHNVYDAVIFSHGINISANKSIQAKDTIIEVFGSFTFPVAGDIEFNGTSVDKNNGSDRVGMFRYLIATNFIFHSSKKLSPFLRISYEKYNAVTGVKNDSGVTFKNNPDLFLTEDSITHITLGIRLKI